MSFKGISYLQLWLPLVWQSETICVIRVEGIIRNYSAKLIWISGYGGYVV